MDSIAIRAKLARLKAKSRPAYYLSVIIVIMIALLLVRKIDLFIYQNASQITKTPYKHELQDIAHLYMVTHRALVKIPNIIHAPYWFRETELPLYKIVIDPADIDFMNKHLPDNIYEDFLGPENKVFVRADFAAEGYSDRVELRYRGGLGRHWRYSKRSLLVNFPDDNFFEKMRSVDIILPSDRGYLIELINNLRLEREGLVVPNMYFARVELNHQDAGVYIIKERFKQEWLEKNAIPDTSEIYSQTRETPEDVPGIPTWGGYKEWRKDINELDPSFADLEIIYDAVKHAPKETIDAVLHHFVDLDKWYRAIVINILTGHAHSMQEGNLNLIVNSATGRIEPLLENMHVHPRDLYPDVEVYDDFTDPLTRYLLSQPEYYDDYLKVLGSMINEENLVADLAYYDELYEKMTPEFYSDQTKDRNDHFYNKYTAQLRSYIIENYERAQELKHVTEPPLVHTFGEGEVEYKDSFARFGELLATPEEFVAANRSFFVRGSDIILPAGLHRFTDDVVIPPGSKLVILPGARLTFGPGVSLVSYSPIEAVGVAGAPIRFSGLTPADIWGAVAVSNTAEPSRFVNTFFENGSSSRKLFGVIYTGMLAAHGADLVVRQSTFVADRDDDAINVKYGTGEISSSVFRATHADAIDLDYTRGFVVKENSFIDIGQGGGGDAIDLSFSDALVTSNTIEGCEDKGVSVGESSTPTIEGNDIVGCDMGIAVKDASRVVIAGNTIAESRAAGVALYVKKPFFGGGSATLSRNTLTNNEQDITSDEQSTYTQE